MAAPSSSPDVVPWWSQFPARAALGALRSVPRIPLTTLEQLFPGIDELEITMRHSGRDRALWHGEAYVLSLVTAYAKPRRILEIGTASGQGTALMAAQAPEAAIDTLDLGNEAPSLGQQRGQPPWQDLSTVGAAYREAGYEDRVTQHFGDSARFDYAPLHGEVDLAFIDGGHTYEYVKEDSANVLRCMRPGGVIVWDDCDYRSPGVSKALVELLRQGHAVHRIVGVRLAMLRVP
jgi:predicted O-methyltransferase YrrM